jgi:hypothetical protein
MGYSLENREQVDDELVETTIKELASKFKKDMPAKK